MTEDCAVLSSPENITLQAKMVGDQEEWEKITNMRGNIIKLPEVLGTIQQEVGGHASNMHLSLGQ